MSEPLRPDYDPETLRETFPDTPDNRARVTQLRAEIRDAPDEIAELVARGDLVDLLRGLGELDDALNEALAAADRAEIAGTPAQQVVARVRLAGVHQARGEFADSNVLFTELGTAASRFGPLISALVHQRQGENAFAQGHWLDAVEHFGRAVALREELDLEPDEIARSRVALDAARARQGQA